MGAHRRVVDNGGISIAVVVYEDVKTLTGKIANDIEEPRED